MIFSKVSLVFLVLKSGVGHATTKEIVVLVVGSFLEIAWLIVGTLLVCFYIDRLLFILRGEA